MPRRSTILSLPTAIRDEINARLVGSGFGNYEGLAAWLAEQGHAISKSSLHRYGQDLQADFEEAMSDVRKTTELARAYVSGDADQQGALIDATARIVQEHLLRVSIELRKAKNEGPNTTAKTLARISRALEGIGRLSLSQKKWADDIRKQATEAAAVTVEKSLVNQGMSRSSIESIKRELLGLA